MKRQGEWDTPYWRFVKRVAQEAARLPAWMRGGTSERRGPSHGSQVRVVSNGSVFRLEARHGLLRPKVHGPCVAQWQHRGVFATLREAEAAKRDYEKHYCGEWRDVASDNPSANTGH